MDPIPGISKTSTAFPVGRSPFLRVPAGSINFNFIGEADTGTPAILKSPWYTTLPPSVFTSAAMTLSVFVLKILTVVIPSFGFTRPFSIANGPTPEEIFPQFPL